MPTTEELLEKLLELGRLEFWLDTSKYVSAMTEIGQASLDMGMWSITLAAGDSIEISFTNPSGYVWVPHYEGLRVSTGNVFEVSLIRDGKVFLYMPGVVDMDYYWSLISPYTGIIETTADLQITNNSAATEWIVGGYIGRYLTTERYRVFKEMFREAALKYDPMRPLYE